MKRAFAQDVKSVPDLTADRAAAEGSSKQTVPETSRRVRTSTAMTIGLALSVGASGLLLPQEGGRAMATEPGATEPPVTKATESSTENVANVSSKPDVEPAPKTASVTSMPGSEPTVQAGRAVDRVADIAQVDAVAVASASTTPKSDVRTEPVLKQPSETGVDRDRRVEAFSETSLARPGDVNSHRVEQQLRVNSWQQTLEQLRNRVASSQLDDSAADRVNTESLTKNGADAALGQQVRNPKEAIATQLLGLAAAQQPKPFPLLPIGMLAANPEAASQTIPGLVLQEFEADNRPILPDQLSVNQQPLELVSSDVRSWEKALPGTWEPKDSQRAGSFAPVTVEPQGGANHFTINQAIKIPPVQSTSQGFRVATLNPRVNATGDAPIPVLQTEAELGRFPGALGSWQPSLALPGVTVLPSDPQIPARVTQTEAQPRALLAVPSISSKNAEQPSASIAALPAWQTSTRRNDANVLAKPSETLTTELPVQLADSRSEQEPIAAPESERTPIDGLKAEIEGLREKYRTQITQELTDTRQPVTNVVVPLNIASTFNSQITELENGRLHRVTSGETLDAIARQYGVSRAELIEANRLSNPNLIKVDQLLKIPQTYSLASTNRTATVIRDLSAVSKSPAREFGQPLPATSPLSVGGLQAPVAIGAAPRSPAPNLPLPSTGNAAFNDTPVAAMVPSMPSVVERRSGQTSALGQPRTYLNGLMNELEELQEKYKARESSDRADPQIDILAARSNGLLPAQEAVKPDFGALVNQSSVGEDLRRPQQRRSTRLPEPTPSAGDTAAETNSTTTRSPRLAVAPLGPDVYNDAMPGNFNRTVSPDLPPLAPPDRYLPEGAPAFNGYIWPAKGTLTSGYGWRWGRMHKGIDIAGPIGTPIVAAGHGVVDFAGWNSGGYGNLVDIRHPDGSLTLYAHNNHILVRKGQSVKQGQQIAEMGSTGYSTGPHLHFEIHPTGQGAVNPMAFLPR